VTAPDAGVGLSSTSLLPTRCATWPAGTVPGTPNRFYKPSLFDGHDYKH
jgi:hypothetical protein